jgi:hypothetical protein
MQFNRMLGDGPRGPLPPPPGLVAPAPGGFILCNVGCSHPMHSWWQQELYRWALAQAQAVVRPSILERDLLAVWN